MTLDWSSGLVCWARAGHPPPLLAGPDGIRPLDGDGHGPVLGLGDRSPYREGTTQVEAGVSLVLYTDGLVERRGEVVDDGLARLADALERHSGSAPDALVPALLGELTEPGRSADDIAAHIGEIRDESGLIRIPESCLDEFRLVAEQIEAAS